jgi:hypothetical protein
MLLVSDFQLLIDGQDKPAHVPFECSDPRTEQQLLSDGAARRFETPKILYETKIVSPPEVGPLIPFRDSVVPHEEPAQVAPEGNQVLSESDVSEQGTVNPGRRGRPFGYRKGNK